MILSDPITATIGAIAGVIDKLIPDPAQRDAAKLELVKAQQRGELDQVHEQLAAIVSDSQSADPWTSRARPAFLYVVYVMLLWGIPMGVLSAFRPDLASAIALGFKQWLAAIPDSVLTLFGVVMTGYVAGRSWEKVRGAAS